MSPQVRPNVVAVGLDLGGTATRFVSLDDNYRVDRRFIASTPAHGSKESVLRFLTDQIQQLVDPAEIGSIGIGASGPINAEGIIKNFETLRAFSNLDIVGELGATFHVRPTIDNDAVTAAVGEYRVGAGRGGEDVLMLTLGTGVGVCLLQNGVPFRGRGGQHPEASHMTINGPPAPCYCGRSACWEQIASRAALQKTASSIVDSPAYTSADIERAAVLASEGDARAIDLFLEFGRRLADGLANLIAVYAPDRVVIGGSGSNYLPSYGFALRESLAKTQSSDIEIVIAAELGEYGGAIGAALIAAI